MRRLLLHLAVILGAPLSISGLAHADNKSEADGLSIEARELARSGNMQDALEHYEEALALDPDVKRQCNVGSAYFQLDQWAPAHLFLGLCLAQPDSLDASFVEQLSKAYAFADRKLKAGNFALVVVDTEPGGGEILLPGLSKVARFGAPRRVWLALGQHAYVATHPAYQEQSGEFTVAGKGEVEERIALRNAIAKEPGQPEITEGVVTPPEPVSQPTSADVDTTSSPGETSHTSAWASFAVGGAGLLTGVGFHIKAVGVVSDLESLGTGDERNEKKDTLKRDRWIMGIGYGIGAVGLGLGYYLWQRAEPETGPTLSAGLQPRGAHVSVGWNF